MTTKQPAIGIYVRTSTADQEDGLESQIHSCRNKIVDGDLDRVELYKDDGVSGTVDEREDYQRLLRDIDSGDVETVVVSEISRLSRSTYTLIGFLERVFDEEVGLEVADGSFPSIEAGNPFMQALARMMAVLAELERDLTSIRVQRGIQNAIEQGKWHGRPPKGFTTNDDGYLAVVPDEFGSVATAIEAVELGESVYAAANAANIPQQTLRDIYNDEEKRQLYIRGDADAERIQDAIEEADFDATKETEIGELWNEIQSLREESGQ